MAEEEEGKGRGFRVEDKRRFVPTSGEPRPPENSPDQPQETISPKVDESSEAQRPEIPPRSSIPPPSEISFSSFILGLTTQALIYMGEIPPAPGHPIQTDLSSAQQMIDILSILKQKTAGNLDTGEEAMLGNALFDLRIRYVDLVKKSRETTQEKGKS
jgi:hypothetical protein